MAIKSAIVAKIQAALSGTTGLSTWAKLESYLHTDPASVLESVYPAELFDSSVLEIITTKNNNFSYAVIFSKVGRHVNVYGRFNNITGNNQLFNALVFALKPGEYACTTNTLRNQTVAQGTNGTIGLTMSSTGLRLNNTVLAYETFNFSLTYNTLD